MSKTIEEQIAELESQMTSDMMMDMDVKDQIHTLNLKLRGVSCTVDNPDCEACGS